MGRYRNMYQFKYVGCVVDELGTDGAKYYRKVAGAIRSLVNAMRLQLECARMLH